MVFVRMAAICGEDAGVKRCMNRWTKPFVTYGLSPEWDFYAEGIGWVPADPSMAISEHSADAGFGRERTDMVIMHFDLIRFFHQYCWLQGIGAVRSKNEQEGTGAGMTLKHTMTVLDLGPDDEPAAAPTRPNRSPKRKSAPTRRSGT